MLLTILFSLVPIIFLISIFIIGFSWYIASDSLKPVNLSKTKTPGDHQLPFENFSVVSDGLTLKGWFIPVQDASKKSKAPPIILTHGWGGNSEKMLPHAEYLNRAGFNIILYDLRGHGDSDPVELTSLNRMLRDFDKIMEYVLSRAEVDENAIGLMGHSIGAAASILKASQDERVKAVVSSSSFADFDYLAEQTLRSRGLRRFPFQFFVKIFWRKLAGVALETISPVYQIGKIAIPLLLIHGDQDEVISAGEFEKLSKSAKKAEKFLIKGVGHSDLYLHTEFCKKTTDFFTSNLL